MCQFGEGVSCKFKIGDMVLRTFCNFRDCEVGKAYEVEAIEKVVATDNYSLKIKGASGTYDPNNFKLDPVSRSPLWEALK